MSKAKWFAVRKLPHQPIKIVPLKFWGGPTKMLYYIHQTPLSSCSVEGGSGDETRSASAQWLYIHEYDTVAICIMLHKYNYI